MYSGRTAPLRYPSEDFTAAAVKANKGRASDDLINPWLKKTKAKEPALVERQKQEAALLEKTRARKASHRSKKATGTKDSRVLPPKTTVVKTMFAENSQWLNKVEQVVKAASPNTKITKNNTTPSTSKITNHFKAGKVTPPSATASSKKNEPTKPTHQRVGGTAHNIATNPYNKDTKQSTETTKSITEEMEMEKTKDSSATNTTKESTMKKITDIFPKQSASFADAASGKTFERIMQKYTRRFAVSFNVQIKID